MLCGWLPPEKLLICCVDDYHLKKIVVWRNCLCEVPGQLRLVLLDGGTGTVEA
jgi:hypothetical protein